ncbi:MAG TPA: putative ABC exporter domain-containing protein, partial [Gemmatimonadaceae bacterium]|nr:putative ABC exporter domain-containing protein [Gemmatimonadaceae bacterium]
MIVPFLWLTWRGFRNRTIRQIRRVRQPRYAVAMIAGLFYFWWIFFRPDRPRPMASAISGGDSAEMLLTVFSLGLALMVGSFWLLGSGRAPLTFTQAEVQLLFPAPITRRELVELKLFQAQLAIILSTVVWVVLLGRRDEGVLQSGIALWILFTTMYLHRVGASLVRTSASGHGVAGARHNRWTLIVLGAVLLAVLWSVLAAFPSLRAAANGGDLVGALGDLLHSPAIAAVLFPFRLVLAPLLAASSVEWLRAILPALLILLLHVPWVLRTDAAFEEAAAEAAVKRAERIEAVRSRRGRVRAPRATGARNWLPLAPRGRPANAIVWKNIIAITRTIPTSTAGMVVAVIVVSLTAMFMIAPNVHDTTTVAAILMLVAAGFLVVVGPLWIRNDLRLDMLRLELLRAYPLSGTSIVRAELVASTAVLTLLQYLLVIASFFALWRGGPMELTLSERTAALLIALLVAPAVNSANLLVQNAAALLFPEWVRLGLARPGGVEAMGQAIVTTVGSMLVLGFLLLLPAVLGLIFGLILLARIGVWGLVPGAALSAGLV